MQQVVTLVGVETKTGQGQKGPWTLKVYKDAGGNKYQTFDGPLQQIADSLLGQSASVVYDVETRNYTDQQGQARTANNNVLRFIEASAGTVGATAQAEGNVQTTFVPQTVTAQTVQQDDRPIRSHETNRADALKIAVEAHAAGIAVVSDPMQLAAIADLFVKYIETGSF